MKHITIKHPDGDISLDEIKNKIVDRYKNYLIPTEVYNNYQSLIDKIVQLDAIIQEFERKEKDRYYDRMDRNEREN